ncbi:MAG: sensor domain-containing diguanylate cyclase [Deltaproteobacteria bacterium]|nr:sensor domain-containing diguanylate cyclase [Deltaproteobacteria bacterium]
MGRNADKKKMRRQGHSQESAGPGLVSAERAPVDELDVERQLVPGLEVPPGLDEDGSMMRALFRITCLLSVRDRHGVPPANMHRVAAELAAIVQADTMTLMRLDRGDDLLPARLTLIGAEGLVHIDQGLVTFELGDGVAGQVALHGSPISIEDAPRDPRFARLYGQRTEIGSLLAVPLCFGGRVVGVVTASRREIRAFSPVDQERLTVAADSVAQDLEQARLLIEATTDPLTGLGSRLALLLALPREVEVARRYGTDLSLLIVDVDGLAAINTGQGRAVGDRVLVECGRRLRAAVRAADLPVRLGADELAVVLPMTPANNARALAKRLVRTLQEPIPTLDGVALSYSVGVATLAGADEDPLAFLWRCDAALEQAKREGGDRIVGAVVPRRTIE